MIKIRSLTTCLLAGAVFLLAGCGGDDGPTGNSGDAVTSLEAEYLLIAVFDFLEGNLPLFTPAPGAAPVPYSELFDPVIDEAEECEISGSGTFTGTISGDWDTQSESGDLDIVASAAFNNCAFFVINHLFTVNGAPSLEFDADFTIDEQADTETDVIDIGGAVSYTTDDDRAGTCAVDAVVTIASTGTSETVTATGSVCGANASNFDFTFF